MLAKRQTRLTAAEYLEAERRSPLRHELVQGEAVAMSGASLAHNRIVSNLAFAFGPALRARGCDVFSSDMRVKVPGADAYAYPDLVVVCSEPRLEDQEFDTLLNPTCLVEVLSASTERYDRGYKAIAYRALPSLQLLLLVSQDEARIEVQRRQPDGSWTIVDLAGLGANLELPEFELAVPLAEIYRRVLPPQSRPSTSTTAGQG
jgi:Uma2 family endonuclease